MILRSNELESQVKRWQDDQLSIVFTNGCFDLLHQGHIDLLTQAKTYGDKLIVGLNSDESVRRLKGLNRPIEPLSIRATHLWGLGFIAAIAVFVEDTPLSLIQKIRPDVLVKGGDYNPKEIVGYREVISWGGQVEIIPLTPGYSTTEKVEQMRREGLV